MTVLESLKKSLMDSIGRYTANYPYGGVKLEPCLGVSSDEVIHKAIESNTISNLPVAPMCLGQVLVRTGEEHAIYRCGYCDSTLRSKLIRKDRLKNSKPTL